MGRFSIRVILIVIVILGCLGVPLAQPLRLTAAAPDEARGAVEKYASALGKYRIEQVDRIGDMTFLFVVRVTNEVADEIDITHYIITTKYRGYKIIYDGFEKTP